MKLTEPILTFEMIPESSEHNVLGFEHIHIWCFNYDGKGAALVTYDDKDEFDSLHGRDLDGLLFGNLESDVLCYRPVPKIGQKRA
jgi:hypothetical protein